MFVVVLSAVVVCLSVLSAVVCAFCESAACEL